MDVSFELGAFAGIEIDNWIFTVGALGDVYDRHDGFVLGLSGGYTWPVNNSWTFSFCDTEMFHSVLDASREAAIITRYTSSGIFAYSN